MVTIRREKPEDYPVVGEVNRLAFGGEYEARLVEKIRQASGFIPDLSLVAEVGGKVVGHILFSVIHIQTETRMIPVLALAPVAVLPDYQNHGIGSLLIREGIKKCEQLGHSVIILLGHPDYYPRFGFKPAGQRGLKLPFDAPDEAFMVFEILPHGLDGISGTVVYPPEFNEEG
jgi:putative acetyltransferase